MSRQSSLNVNGPNLLFDTHYFAKSFQRFCSPLRNGFISLYQKPPRARVVPYRDYNTHQRIRLILLLKIKAKKNVLGEAKLHFAQRGDQ